ncbi:uridine kinase [Anaerobranca californiensis DSM 14826]|jgi:uridine kinase|uniref:Uridine kinase n=1 Tax=Anaerobranca californiensis DSM 14826 TaxID=1120989 RepID=A0A1M6LCY5_9FIRM|nr:uridine kinase [Anaerobranca californiensis]SHJ69049.1 uridine kinase [Anaerobranca californiensis DSM 14826]
MERPMIIGIAGGTGSGKTTVAQKIFDCIDKEHVAVIEHDAYYKDQSHISFEERLKTNYDHPFAFDTELLIQHLKDLRNGKAIEKPVYSFVTHTRQKERVRVEPRKIIILEGILILEDKRIRDLLDIKVYVDTDADVRIIRRLLRDIKERGRTIESVVEQYLSTVRPMHLQFVEPSKKYADIIVPEGGENLVAIDILVTKVLALLNN